MILIDCLTLRVDVDIRPVFIYGAESWTRNTTDRWPCRACRGRAEGCEACEGTGLQYPDSADLIGEPFRLVLSAEDTSFHGMGREDIDVRCLGRGRPFVLEVKRPKVRRTDLEIWKQSTQTPLEKSKSAIYVGLIVARLVELKNPRKSPTIRFQLKSRLKSPHRFNHHYRSDFGTTTPKRVSHRRADKNRKRKVVSIDMF